MPTTMLSSFHWPGAPLTLSSYQHLHGDVVVRCPLILLPERRVGFEAWGTGEYMKILLVLHFQSPLPLLIRFGDVYFSGIFFQL